MPIIREMNPDEIDLLIEHLERHFQEPGVGGIIAQPFSESEPFKGAEYKLRAMKRWSQSPGIGHWEKMWVLVDENKIVGHIDLVGHGNAILSHRARLGLGIEIPYRGNGNGKKLMAAALDWALEQPFLAWIDLDVFSHNAAAINLYKQFGFITVGETPDRIRVGGQRIDDLHMIKAVKTEDLMKPCHSVQLFNLETLEYIEMNTKSEKLSHSAILTEKTDFQKLFVHHEIIPTGRRSSRPHFHTLTEEMFLVLEGEPTFIYGDESFVAKPGDYIAFPPGERKLHCVCNSTDRTVRVLGICADHPLDETKYDVN